MSPTLAYLAVFVGVAGHASSEFFAVLSGVAWGVWVDPTTLFDKPPVAAWSLLTLALWNTTLTQLSWPWLERRRRAV